MGERVENPSSYLSLERQQQNGCRPGVRRWLELEFPQTRKQIAHRLHRTEGLPNQTYYRFIHFKNITADHKTKLVQLLRLYNHKELESILQQYKL